jgi:hypothetical protein
LHVIQRSHSSTFIGHHSLTDRAYVTRDIKTPDPIPTEGQEAALELMKTGRLYRYNIAPGEESVVSMCEKEICDYTGFNYCVKLVWIRFDVAFEDNRTQAWWQGSLKCLYLWSRPICH